MPRLLVRAISFSGRNRRFDHTIKSIGKPTAMDFWVDNWDFSVLIGALLLAYLWFLVLAYQENK